MQGEGAALFRHVILPGAHRQDRGAHGRIDVGHQLARFFDARGVGHPHRHGVALGVELVDRDVGLAEHGADVADHGFGAIARHLIEIHLQHQIGAALQVQTQIDGLAGQPVEDLAAHIFGQRIG